MTSADPLPRDTPKRVLLWTGAGVSHPAPTSLPLGGLLTRRALEDLCVPGTLEELEKVSAVLGLVDAKGKPLPPRLEVVLGAAIGAAPGAVADLLHAIIDAPPNDLHELAAAIIGAGGASITVNFDTCIERAINPSSDRPLDDVLHLHGALRSVSDLQHLGAYFHIIEQGLPEEVSEQLDRLLSQATDLWIAGYSASDYFDVRPYVRSLHTRGVDLAGLQVMWIVHEPGADPVELNEYISWLEAAGATVDVERGATDEVLVRLAASAGVSWTPSTYAPTSSADPSKMQQDDPARARVTKRFFDALGYTKGIEDLIDRELVVPSIDDLGRIAWAKGAFNTARRIYRNAPAVSRADRMHRAERTGACFWAQGRLSVAAFVLWRSNGLATACLESLDPGEVNEGLNWLDTCIRTLDHMEKTELRIVPQAEVRRRLRILLPTSLDSLPFDLRARIGEVSTWLMHGTGSDEALAAAASAQEGMAEATALSGNLNYRHREIRDRVSDGERVPPEEYMLLQVHMQEIGAGGDAARVVLIPGAEAAFTMPKVVRDVFSVQFGNWQRLRIVGVFTLKRLRIRAGALQSR